LIYAYFIIIFIVGLYNSKNKDNNDYLYVSRKLTLPSFIATIVTTWYGGILEIGRFSYLNGIVTWIIFGFFYYISAIIFALYIGPKLHKNNIHSIPEYFRLTYGKIPQKITSIILILVSSPAPYLMILSTILIHIFNIDFNIALISGIIFSISYIYLGGFRAIIKTDLIQFIFMYLGFSLMLFYLIYNFGGMEYLADNSPSKNLTFTGNLPIGYILSWSLIAMSTFIDPNIFQRTYSSKDIHIIKKGFVFSIFLWFIFDVLTISVGIYASAIIDSKILGDMNPYLFLADTYLPSILKNIFYIGLLSIVMSTIDSFFFVSSITIGNDLISSKESSLNTKIGLIITGIISYIIANKFTFAIDVWYIFGSIAASTLLIPFLLIVFNKKRVLRFPVASLIMPIIVSVIWIYYDYPYQIDLMYPGILSSLIICLFNKKSVFKNKIDQNDNI